LDTAASDPYLGFVANTPDIPQPPDGRLYWMTDELRALPVDDLIVLCEAAGHMGACAELDRRGVEPPMVEPNAPQPSYLIDAVRAQTAEAAGDRLALEKVRLDILTVPDVRARRRLLRQIDGELATLAPLTHEERRRDRWASETENGGLEVHPAGTLTQRDGFKPIGRRITVVGTSLGRDGVSVAFDGASLHGDPFLVEHVEQRVSSGWRVAVAGITEGPATLDLDDPLLTQATLASVFDEVTDVQLVGVKVEDDAPKGAVY
jgi:hypothetical protein